MALLNLTVDVPVHDPLIVKEGSVYYCFSTHGYFYTSSDLLSWKYGGKVFEKLPDWVFEFVPDSDGKDFWAPEIVYRNGEWRLYYSVSSFGKNTSVIGLACNKTLDPTSKNYGWRDCGRVVSSGEGDKYNAIDPAVCADESGKDWLLFGSFWGGLVLHPLCKNGAADLNPEGKLVEPLFIASRQKKGEGLPEPNPIEGGFIFPHKGKYYLFASHDFCCRGVASSYHIVFGVSDKITGPYIDDEGIDMRWGGGATLRDSFSFEKWAGPGHNTVFKDDDGKIYLVYHAYDRKDDGRSKLMIEEIEIDKL
ncbi:arabinan endo-1,5-alpha-L-arabinosidase [uncultured Treponema sp.]|uniref:arabinan endo-1,5-alpha-L-arabinosidase n=1 Tax=uncultured Treponema sp. TaxID=162155 RepID=UPI0025D748DC|nr:arabinan endo-1,5-alpha-L-arabinosidase [uncultured Treponema sp.]